MKWKNKQTNKLFWVWYLGVHSSPSGSGQAVPMVKVGQNIWPQNHLLHDPQRERGLKENVSLKPKFVKTKRLWIKKKEFSLRQLVISVGLLWVPELAPPDKRRSGGGCVPESLVERRGTLRVVTESGSSRTSQHHQAQGPVLTGIGRCLLGHATPISIKFTIHNSRIRL